MGKSRRGVHNEGDSHWVSCHMGTGLGGLALGGSTTTQGATWDRHLGGMALSKSLNEEYTQGDMASRGLPLGKS